MLPYQRLWDILNSSVPKTSLHVVFRTTYRNPLDSSGIGGLKDVFDRRSRDDLTNITKSSANRRPG
jgi:hypothetical protein